MSRETGWYPIKSKTGKLSEWQVAECIDDKWWRLAGVEGMVLGTFIDENYEIGKTPVNPVSADDAHIQYVAEVAGGGDYSGKMFYGGEILRVDDFYDAEFFNDQESAIKYVKLAGLRLLKLHEVLHETRVVKEGEE